MKRFVCLLAVLMLLLCGCTPEEPTTVPTEPTVPTTPAPTVPQVETVQQGRVKLTRQGQFLHESNMLFAYGDFLLRYDKNSPDAPYQLLSHMGQSQLPGHYNAAAYYGNGVALVSPPDGLVGLVNYRLGLEIVGCEVKQVVQLSARYFLLVYPDGTVRFADATAGLVPDVVLNAIPDAYGAWGEGFYVCDGDETRVYLADGTQALTMNNVTVVGDYAIEGAFGGVNIYGPDYTQVSTKLQYPSQRLDLLEGGYLRHYDDGAYSVLDLQGNSVCADTFQDVDRVVEGCIIACKEASWGMTAVSGEEILPYAYAAIEYLGDGMFLLEETSGSKILYDLAGVQTDVTNFERSGCYFYKQTPAGREYLLRNGSTRTFAGEVEELDHGLLLTPNGLFELYSGTRFFLDYDYDRVEYCDGFVYARMHGIWTVFQIEVME